MDTSASFHSVSAQEEYRRNPDLRKEDIKHLREWMAAEKHLPTVTDEMLIMFHYSCYLDMPSTKHCIESYYTLRSRMPEFFTNRDVSSPQLATSLQTLMLAPLPVAHPRTGTHFMYHGLRHGDASQYVFGDAVKLTLMMVDAFALDHGTVPGIAVVYDMAGTGIGHVVRVSLLALRKYSAYLQEAIPVRLKAIHLVNANFLVGKVLLLSKPFLKKELYEAIHIHKPGDESLYDHIPRECLPSEFGGTLESKLVYCDALVETLQRRAAFFAIDESINRVNESLRVKKPKRSLETDKDGTAAESKAQETSMDVN